ncbi:hypothetical protein K2173_021302 [Erythroxylum novogranatense]|uniref:LysM domain receptor-like kinase 4 n=1 Tax=Erythroxylum novogranatense TaxID=1862640 RepID=A0AAV8TXT5_9ROSI|nr:hypothetical protein K2173_021302 [Erythroxylum novogranatense]
MSSYSVVSLLFLCNLCSCILIYAQQPYVGTSTTDCSNTKSSALGFFCNGMNNTCQSYLTFRSQPPYNTVGSISTLLGSDPSKVSMINEVSENATFETNKLVIVPVNCSCSGEYYQTNTSYVVQKGDTYFLIANNTYQGLSTCQALLNQSTKLTKNIYTGETVSVPLRCACPTKNQSDVGIKYLLSYVVTFGDTVSAISVQFGADTGRTLQANELSEQNYNIYPFTTLLVPLQKPPSSSDTVVPPPPPSLQPPPPSSPSTSGKNSSKTWVYLVVGVVAGISLTLAAGAGFFFAFIRRSKKKADPVMGSETQSFEAVEKSLNKKLDEESLEFLGIIPSIAKSIKVYKFEELKVATDNFSPSCWIKGSVYRASFNGDFAAIKKMNGDVSKEINLLNKINHSNVIRLSGVCFSDGHWYLVYEYGANGPLSDWIYQIGSHEKLLTWRQRIQIAFDVATGLNYLHNFTSPPYIHKDMKCSNVLLDSNFKAKIANLALARSAENQEGEFTLTRHIVGTKGYMAPEYLENGIVSTKIDVFAFGVLTLEILTGKEIPALYREENMCISDVLKTVLCDNDEPENLSQFIDSSMQGNYPVELAVVFVRLIDSCLQKNPSDRPAMDEIAQSLSRILSSSLSWELSSGADSGHRSSKGRF